MGEETTIMGTVLSVVFQNEENGYAVLRLVTDDGELLTLVGCVPCAAPGENLTATGSFSSHPQYGEQFSASEVERYLPSNETEILNYLASGVVRGVGPATAEKLVARFGIETLQVLESEPEKLTAIKGMTARRAQEISAAFNEQMGLRRVMEFLAHYDLPAALSVPLYRRFGANAMAALERNPYLLSDSAFGVDFSVCDEIALSMGFGGDASLRTEAGLTFELSHNRDAGGHVFLPREKLLAATAQLLDCDIDAAEKSLDDLIAIHRIVQEGVANVTACYLRQSWEDETYVVTRIEAMLADKPDALRGVERVIKEIEREQGVQYAPLQRQAVELAAKEELLLLTGGPGTGKTTSVRAIVALFERMGLNVLLAAPTGRAAKRMGELCDRDAQTIHRMLGMTFNDQTGEVTFTKGEKEPLEADALIVDETSMVDLALMRALLAALRPGCRLVLVGDPDQLPSVGAGNVFSDLIRSGRIATVALRDIFRQAEQLPSVGAGNVFSDLIRSGRIATVALRDIFRQAEQSMIVRNAHLVNTGMPPKLKNAAANDFFFLPRRDSVRLVETVVELCKTRLPAKMGIPADELQVLTPTRRGDAGTRSLNFALQAALNPPKPGKQERRFGELIFREGDRVMQTRNDYDVVWQKEDGTAGTGIFNGDVGKIAKIDPSGELLEIVFDDRTATYTSDMLAELDMAYAMTVHKAQGSEYRGVVFVGAPCAPSLMVRGVLYTAITRARELLVIVGDDSAVNKMAENDRRSRRYSGLKWRLRKGGEEK